MRRHSDIIVRKHLLPLVMQQKRYVFLPLNRMREKTDVLDVCPHWALLVVELKPAQGVLKLYDSAPKAGFFDEHVQVILRALRLSSAYCAGQETASSWPSHWILDESKQFNTLQTDAHSCGLFLC